MTSAPDMDDQSFEHPKLRLIDFRPLMYEGEAYIALHDPLMLSEKTLLSPQPFIPLLGLCDGTRSVAGLRTSLAIRYGISLTTERINEFLAVLDEAFLLDNQRSRQARAEASIEFRRAPFRPLSSAGQSYPENADDLARMLAQYSTPPNRESDNDIRGLVSPHIDYNRGGPVYAQAWSGAAQAARNADLAIIFGTDHFSEGFPFSLTRQSYATPFGILPTDTHIVDLLAEVIGVEPAYAGELHHRGEHSIELAANWLHYIRSGKPISTVPVLTGSIEPLIEQGNGQLVDAVLEVLSMAMKNHHVLVIAAGDLAHVGSAFDTAPVDSEMLTQLKATDDELIDAICRGDAEGFFSAIQCTGNASQVCGVSPIYLTLRLLAPTRGEKRGYSVCPADDKGTSFVTICGVTLHAS